LTGDYTDRIRSSGELDQPYVGPRLRACRAVAVPFRRTESTGRVCAARTASFGMTSQFGRSWG